MSIEVKLPSGKLTLNIEDTEFSLKKICGFACRQNPKRGFLFVSKVLGKHLPVKPSKMKEVYDILAIKATKYTQSSDKTMFLGFAETATGLGSGIYDSWKKMNKQESLYLNTTRYLFNKEILFRFEEEHSHATGHIVYKPDNLKINEYKNLVLIDDEMTTGKTMRNFISQFTKLNNVNLKKIVVICIKNWMSNKDKEEFKLFFKDIEIDFVSILNGNYFFEKDEKYICEKMPNVETTNKNKDMLISKNYGRFGLNVFNNYNFDKYLKKSKGKKVLVLGTGEFTYQPYLFAKTLEDNGVDVVFQSTTRSPILVGNDIKSKIEFEDNYGDGIKNYLYNVIDKKYDKIYICYETNEIGDFDLDIKLNAENVFFDKLETI